MAYQSKDLSVLSYASGFTLWYFTTNDKLSEVLRGGYFAAANTMFRKGDHIHVNADMAADPAGALLIVKGNDGDGVRVGFCRIRQQIDMTE